MAMKDLSNPALVFPRQALRAAFLGVGFLLLLDHLIPHLHRNLSLFRQNRLFQQL